MLYCEANKYSLSLSRLGEVSHVEAWASRNNLRLNGTKSKELIFVREKSVQSQPPPPCPNTERVGCAKVLGITLNVRLSATDHVNNLLTSCSSLLYVMRVLRGHGISTESLHDVFRATILAKITYCLPAWSGLCSASDRAKLDSFLNRCIAQPCAQHTNTSGVTGGGSRQLPPGAAGEGHKTVSPKIFSDKQTQKSV